MTLSEAVAVLNQHRYRGHGDWRITDHLAGDPLERFTCPAGMFAIRLVPFEVIAVAEKIQREATPAQPEKPAVPVKPEPVPVVQPAPAQPAPVTQPATATTQPAATPAK